MIGRSIAIYEQFGKVAKEFDFNWLKEKENVPVKFIQVYFQNEPHIRIGEMYHKRLLFKFLEEINAVPHLTRITSFGREIPLEKGSCYEMVGAGKIRVVGNNLNFWKSSQDYGSIIRGTNRKHLESFFGENNVFEKNFDDHPFFIVNYEGKLK